MTEAQAIQKARKLAALRKQTMFVIYEPGEDGGFAVTNDRELDTFFCGIDPLYAVTSSGEVCRD